LSRTVARRMGHRERKKEKTKQLLTEAALRLFAERGYDETKIDDIAAAADVVPRTFFRYFDSKTDVLLAWHQSISKNVVEAFRARPKGEGIVNALAATHLEAARSISAEHRVIAITRQIGSRFSDIGLRYEGVQANYQRLLAHELAGRLPASARAVAVMINAAVMAAFTDALDRWAAEGGKGSQTDYTVPALKKAVKLFEAIDREYVLR
jgi:AcrR family transcriptional regulator